MIKYNWFVPAYKPYFVSVFAHFVYTVFVIFCITILLSWGIELNSEKTRNS